MNYGEENGTKFYIVIHGDIDIYVPFKYEGEMNKYEFENYVMQHREFISSINGKEDFSSFLNFGKGKDE